VAVSSIQPAQLNVKKTKKSLLNSVSARLKQSEPGRTAMAVMDSSSHYFEAADFRR
jgi:hypothetical protein